MDWIHDRTMLMFAGHRCNVSSHREDVCSEIGRHAKRGNCI